MPFDLAVRPTVINGNRYRSDFIVVWKSDFGERRVGRIRRSDSSNLNSVWVYHLQADIPVPPSGNGRADREIVAEVDNGLDAVAAIIENKPDVAIVDYLLPLINGIDVARDIKTRQIDTEILIFTMYDSDVLVNEAFKAGARGFLLKSDAKEQLISAIEALLVHKPFFTGAVSEKLLASYLSTKAPPMDALTPRERMVVKLIAEGQTSEGIAKMLNLSAKTIQNHRASAMDKISVKSRVGLIHYAVKNKLIEP